MLLPLLSERLLLRDFQPEDWPAVHAYGSRPEVYRYQPWGPMTPEDARACLVKIAAEAQEQPRTDYTLAMVMTGTATVIGACNLTIHSQRFRCNLHRSGEIGYSIHPDYWRQGYATEAAQCLLRFGFATLGLHRIIGQCDPRNTATARVLERIGMRYEGHLRETMLIRDGWRDSLIYNLLEQEWAALHPAP